ncbi:MAG: antibiotic biosynthesis monooxygenase [Planctomycetaceae bacterium]|nr:antibiotic biosynthesis monooxygenase [Planctomycetaceae bacterium]
MIHVIASIHVVAGGRDKFLTAFRKLVPLVLAEEGCIEYGPTIDAATDIPAQARKGDDVVTVVEKWESVAALKAHLVAPHMQEYRGQVKPLVTGTTLHILESA